MIDADKQSGNKYFKLFGIWADGHWAGWNEFD